MVITDEQWERARAEARDAIRSRDARISELEALLRNMLCSNEMSNGWKDEIQAALRPYRMIYLSDLGYTVYRNSFDENKCTRQDGARAHKVAVFVEEDEARRYVTWRNFGMPDLQNEPEST